MESQVSTSLIDLDIGQRINAAAQILGYQKLPVSIEQFYEDEYYLGRVCKDFYPFWKEHLKIIYPTQIHTTYPIIVYKGANSIALL